MMSSKQPVAQSAARPAAVIAAQSACNSLGYTFDPKSRVGIELIKTMTKLVGRIERLMVPVNTTILTNYMMSLPHRLDAFVKARVRIGEFFIVSSFSGRVVVDWDCFDAAIVIVIAQDHPDGDNFVLPNLIIQELSAERNFQDIEEMKSGNKEKMRILQSRNGQPVMPGKWHKDPYTKRVYQELENYTVTSYVSDAEAESIRKQLVTPLDGFLGQAYNYDDHGLTEEWMVTFADSGSAAPSDDEVIRVQCSSLLDILTAQVQDRVCNDDGVLNKAPVGLRSGKLKEAQVWGIDCYTRRMIEIAIEDRIGKPIRTSSTSTDVDMEGDNAAHVKTDTGGSILQGSFTEKELYEWFERVLMPSINAQPHHIAHNLLHVTSDLLAKHESGERLLVELHVQFTKAVQSACLAMGIDMFRIHPKGTGIICTATDGIQPHVLISEYLGDIYPPYRWCERLDVVAQAQQKYSLKPTLPDFYNILLERPRQDPQGYGLLFVDASQKSNMGSSCSHSCTANTSAMVVARNGQLTIALTTNRFVHPGEELTMDYSALTTSDIEWRAAICLCGSPHCRGSFLHYATQDDLQQVLNQNCGPLWRYASLLKSCSLKPCSKQDMDALDRHGIRSVALSASSKPWMKKYSADILRFLEFERKALPCCLMRSVNGKKSAYTFSTADLDARSVMEQRLQSLVCCFSMIQRSIDQQPLENQEVPPLAVMKTSEVLDTIWGYLQRVPCLVEENVKVKTPEIKKKDRNVPTVVVAEVEASAITPMNIDDNKENVSSAGAGAEVVTKADVNVLEISLETAQTDYVEKVKRLKRAIVDLRAMVIPTQKPTSLTGMRALSIKLRTILLQIEDLSTPIARLGLLADILVLWAYTTNFSKVHKYTEISSEPIPVVARDLGMCVPRSKIYNPTSKRLQGSKTSELSLISEMSVGSDLIDELPFLSSESDSIVKMDVPTVPTSAEAVAAALYAGDKSGLCDPNEIVHTGSKRYGPSFAFDQLMSWYDAGTDEKLLPPDIIGCVQLPLPIMCFGPSDSTYTAKQRALLLEHLGDDKDQSMPWPISLKACFNYSSVIKSKSDDTDVYGSSLAKAKKDQIDMTPIAEKYRMKGDILLGSPMLDVALGQVDAVLRVMEELLGAERAQVWLAEKAAKKARLLRKTRKERGSTANDDEDDTQFDDILPPELPTAWVQCEGCRKWRRVPWNIDADSLPEEWFCQNNTWDTEKASCDVEQDVWDPTRESTLETVGTIADEDTFEVGTWRDVFCIKNQCYYEGQIKQVQPALLLANGDVNPKRPAPRILFHFKGWSSKFDEWVSINSDRIAPLNLYTNPNPLSSHPSDQERWQGKQVSFLPKEKGKGSHSMENVSSKRKATSSCISGTTKRVGLKNVSKAKRLKTDWSATIY